MTDLVPESRMAEWLEQAWLDRYVARELTESERDRFEAYMLDKPHLLEQIESDSDLADAARTLAATASEPPQADSNLVSAISSGVHREASIPQGPRSSTEHGTARRIAHHSHGEASRTRWLRFPALAASLMLALAAGWFGNARLDRSGGPGSIAPDPTRIVFDSLRGAGGKPTVQHVDSVAPTVLVEIGVPLGATDIELLAGAAAAIPLRVSSDGFVSFTLSRDRAAVLHDSRVRYRLQGQMQEIHVDLADALASQSPPST